MQIVQIQQHIVVGIIRILNRAKQRVRPSSQGNVERTKLCVSLIKKSGHRNADGKSQLHANDRDHNAPLDRVRLHGSITISSGDRR